MPDTEEDILKNILQSIRFMPPKQAFEFLHFRLDHAAESISAKLLSLFKTPELLCLFAELEAIPMFGKTGIINVNLMYTWRRVPRIWMDVLLKYGCDTLRYLACPPTFQPQPSSILDVMDLPSSSTNFEYGFLEDTFHTLVNTAYRDILSPHVLSFGISGGVQLGTETQTNWLDAFTLYRQRILESLKEYTESPATSKQFRPFYAMLIKRVTYLLDNAWQQYPRIKLFGAPLPIICKAFVYDIGAPLAEHERGFIEVSVEYL